MPESLEYVVDNAVLTKATEGEEVEGQWVKEEYQRREDGHKHQTEQGRHSILEMFSTKVR